MAPDKRRALGRRGEEIAARHLERLGWRIVERNYRSREGELDLIAARGGTLAFCEVKTLVCAQGPADARAGRSDRGGWRAAMGSCRCGEWRACG